jgi:hypothetical protein
MNTYRIYAKFTDVKTFKALDISRGIPVDNLIHATILNSEELGKAQDYLKLVKQDQPEILLEIRDTQNNKTIFSI